MKWGWVAEPGAEGLLEEVTEQGLQRVGSELCILDVGHPRQGTAGWLGAWRLEGQPGGLGGGG